MENINIPFEGNGLSCVAVVKLDGIADSWIAHAKISGHPKISELHIHFRLGDYLIPLFSSESELQFFSPLLCKIDEKAKMLLPTQFEEGLEAE
ncbi:hypothetical protein [Niastella populi]|uniref:Uncharacterized protein n=1 Tax=Niastella populi TaxID=550983 RepID=A0A1V9GAJ2_9BACT|nr:hypothetical protein [Niastella populi]OQP67633.1 hypothetical protein A4R26_33150 [Niastella populi]